MMAVQVVPAPTGELGPDASLAWHTVGIPAAAVCRGLVAQETPH